MDSRAGGRLLSSAPPISPTLLIRRCDAPADLIAKLSLEFPMPPAAVRSSISILVECLSPKTWRFPSWLKPLTALQARMWRRYAAKLPWLRFAAFCLEWILILPRFPTISSWDLRSQRKISSRPTKRLNLQHCERCWLRYRRPPGLILEASRKPNGSFVKSLSGRRDFQNFLRPPGYACQREFCFRGPQAPAKHCWPRQLPGRRNITLSPLKARN